MSAVLVYHSDASLKNNPSHTVPGFGVGSSLTFASGTKLSDIRTENSSLPNSKSDRKLTPDLFLEIALCIEKQLTSAGLTAPPVSP